MRDIPEIKGIIKGNWSVHTFLIKSYEDFDRKLQERSRIKCHMEARPNYVMSCEQQNTCAKIKVCQKHKPMVKLDRER